MRLSMQGASDPYEPAVKLVRLLQLLERRRGRAFEVRVIAEELEVSERTVKRYADALARRLFNEEWNPLVERCFVDGRSAVRLNRAPSTIEASLYQYAATWMAARVLGAEQTSLLVESVEDLLGRLSLRTPEGRAALQDLLRQSFCYVPFGAKGYRDREDVLDLLLRAILGSRIVRMSYRRPSREPAERLVHPYTLVLYRDALYLLGGNDSELPETRLFALDRIENASMEKATFKRPPRYDPRRHFAQRIGIWQTDEEPVEVLVAFDPGAAAVARERSWPGLVGWEELDDGREALRLCVHPTPELASWVLAWGEQVEVLEPDWLRRRVRRELEGALERYSVIA